MKQHQDIEFTFRRDRHSQRVEESTVAADRKVKRDRREQRQLKYADHFMSV